MTCSIRPRLLLPVILVALAGLSSSAHAATTDSAGNVFDGVTIYPSLVGAGPGQIGDPADIAVTDVGFHIADVTRGIVGRFTAGGVSLGDVGTNNCADPSGANLCAPLGIAVAPSGDIYVADLEEAGSDLTINRFSSAGTYLGSFGAWGSGDGELRTPGGILPMDVDPAGNLFIGDIGNSRVVKFTATGGFVSNADVAAGFDDFALLPDGTFATLKGSQVAHLSANGTVLSTFTTEWLAFRLAALDDGTIVVESSGLTTRYTITGTVLGQIGMVGSTANFQFGGPIDGGANRTLVAWQYVPTGLSFTRTVVRVEIGVPLAKLNVPSTPVLTGDSVTVGTHDSAGMLAPFTSFTYDLDGDGSFESSAGATTTTSFSTPGMKTVGVHVSTATGNDTATGLVDVRLKPPTRPIGVSIEAGATYTNSPDVTLTLSWPALSSAVLVSNDGGFVPSSEYPVALTRTWALDSSGPERLPKTVYVRYSGAGGQIQTFQDDIILDETAPLAKSASIVLKRGVRAKSFAIRASDATSGVKSLQFGYGAKKKTAPWRKYAASVRIIGSAPAWVRVRDTAGNISKWRKITVKRAR